MVMVNSACSRSVLGGGGDGAGVAAARIQVGRGLAAALPLAVEPPAVEHHRNHGRVRRRVRHGILAREVRVEVVRVGVSAAIIHEHFRLDVGRLALGVKLVLASGNIHALDAVAGIVGACLPQHEAGLHGAVDVDPAAQGETDAAEARGGRRGCLEGGIWECLLDASRGAARGVRLLVWALVGDDVSREDAVRVRQRALDKVARTVPRAGGGGAGAFGGRGLPSAASPATLVCTAAGGWGPVTTVHGWLSDHHPREGEEDKGSV
mmetsp:Transcript_17655/g.44422  ORF Transcript_17655/g.44422 Transcript_17655/m.44422 type:complete len:264 (+) Transcript_17655:1142-1933(+)